MFRDCRTQDIVYAEEGRDKLRTVQCVHSCVPAAPHKDKESEPERLHAPQFADIASYEQEHENDEPRQDDADRPLRQYGTSRRDPCGVVEPSITRVSEVEKDE